MTGKITLQNFPVCVAKTQYSFSSDAKLLGRPRDFSFEVSALEIRGGAGFIVAVTGLGLRPGYRGRGTVRV